MDTVTLHVYEMFSGPYRPHQHRDRSRRLRRLLLASWRWGLLLFLSTFIAINSLLYRGINRADGRSMDPRSLSVKEKVISIDSWRTEGDVDDTRWDLYIDSPRQYRGLHRSQRGKGDSEAGANEAAAPMVRQGRRGGGNNTDVDKKRASGMESDTKRGRSWDTVAKRVSAKLNYQSSIEETQKEQARRNIEANRAGKPITRTSQISGRILDHLKPTFNQTKIYRAPVKLKNHVSRDASKSVQQSGRRTVKSWISPTNDDTNGVRFHTRPTWLSEDEAELMKRLAEDPISGFYNFPAQHTAKFGLGFLLYESESDTAGNGDRRTNATDAVRRCRAQGVTCAVLFPPAEIHRVLAFHLDRVLGFHRTLPTVSRRLTEDLRRQVGLPVDVSFPLMLYEPSLYVDVELSKLTKGQLSGCIGGQDSTEGLEWCNNVLAEDWGAVALFDFLLQIYHRLDFGCCGLDVSERQRRCGMSGTGRRGVRCTGGDGGSNKQRMGCNYRLSSEADKLVLVENLVDLHAPADKLDVWLLQGPGSFPAHAVSILREGKLHRMLLQSLFADKGYWEGQGGRPAIEEVLDIIDRRGRTFLKYIGS